MKKNIWMASALICALAVATVSCNNEELAGTTPDGKGQRTTITANAPQNGADTRVSYDETTNPQKVKLAWETSDAIGVWQAGQTTVNEFTASQAGASAEFSGNATFTEGAQYYAVYPKPQSVAAGNVASLDLSAPQSGSMNKAIHYMYASATGMAGNTANFSFTHAVSVLKLSLNFSGVADAPTTLTKVTLSATGLHNKATLTMGGALLGTDAGIITAMGQFDVTNPVYLYIFPESLSDILIMVTDGVKTYEGTLTNSTAVAGKVYMATVAMTVANYIELNSVKVAPGNLIANGDHSATIGAPTDGGLFFQFGSLVGWNGTANDDGTGSNTSSTTPASVVVTPTLFEGKTDWADTDKIWQSKTETVPFTIPNSGSANEKAGVGDPCRYYLGNPWRLPTMQEFETLFKNGGFPTTGPWKWDNTSKFAIHTGTGLKFLQAGNRSNADGSIYTNVYGLYWSSSSNTTEELEGYRLFFYFSDVYWDESVPKVQGFSVRCVRD